MPIDKLCFIKDLCPQVNFGQSHVFSLNDLVVSFGNILRVNKLPFDTIIRMTTSK